MRRLLQAAGQWPALFGRRPRRPCEREAPPRHIARTPVIGLDLGEASGEVVRAARANPNFAPLGALRTQATIPVKQQFASPLEPPAIGVYRPRNSGNSPSCLATPPLAYGCGYGGLYSPGSR